MNSFIFKPIFFAYLNLEMDKEILRFIGIIKDNELRQKSRLPEILDTPEIVDEHPELISDLIDDLENGDDLPSFLTVNLLNGMSSRPEMEEFMEKEFSRFKVVVFANHLLKNQELKDFILEEANKSIKELSFLAEQPSFLDDLNLQEIVNVKIKYCKLTQDLLQGDSTGKKNLAEEIKGIESEERVYVFRLLPEFSKEFHDKLYTLHKRLKDRNFIDGSLPKFKKLFVKHEEGLPDSSPDPVVWKNGTYNSLSYFIKRLSGKIIKPNQGRPAADTFSNNQIALKLFYKRKEGQFFTPAKIGHDNDPSAKVKDIIDSILKDS